MHKHTEISNILWIKVCHCCCAHLLRCICLSSLCWDQLSRSLSSGAAPPFLPPTLLHSTCSHLASSQHASSLEPRALCISYNLGFLAPVLQLNSSLTFYTAVTLFLIHDCSAHLLFSPVSSTRISLMLDCMQSPEQSLAGFIRARKIANSTGSACGTTNRWSLWSLESEDIMRMDYSHCLKTCWFLHSKA